MQQLLQQLYSFKKYIIRLILPLLVIMMANSLFITPSLATGVYEIPELSAINNTWVLDQAEVISRLNEGTISSAFDNLAKQTGNTVRIVTIRRLDYGETPESFAKALFSKWFPTPEAQANQILLVIDTVTNGTAIISGDQVKSLLTDSIANSVASETVGIALRSGNKYNQAFLDASDRLVTVLSGQPDPVSPENSGKNRSQRDVQKS